MYLTRKNERSARRLVFSSSFVLCGVLILIFCFTDAALGQSRAAYLNALFTVTIDSNTIRVDRTGNVKLRTTAIEVGAFEEDCDCAWAQARDHKWGIIDANGVWIVQPRFWGSQDEKFLTVDAAHADGKYRFVNMRGEFVFGGYDEAKHFSEGLAAVKIGGKWGFIDTSGELVIPAIYDKAYFFSDGLGNVSIGERKMYVRLDGSVAFAVEQGTSGGYFYDGRAVFRNGDVEGIYDKDGNVVLSPTYREIKDFSEGHAAFESDKGLWGYLNKDGRVVIPPTFMQVLDFSEGLAAVETIERKWGFIDKTGRLKIAAKYTEEPGSFHYGLANVGTLFGENVLFIDKNGKIQFTGRTVLMQMK